MALYCSDVSGAFDRVDTSRLLDKLWAKGLRGRLWKVVQSWLQTRTAKVVVEGVASHTVELKNMVYQGTVWGPPLWNVFFEDASKPVQFAGFQDAFFADDLNCYKTSAETCANEALLEEMAECQVALYV